MIGWQWCPGAREHCRVCGKWAHGVWKHWISDTTANVFVCADCAGGTTCASTPQAS